MSVYALRAFFVRAAVAEASRTIEKQRECIKMCAKR